MWARGPWTSQTHSSPGQPPGLAPRGSTWPQGTQPVALKAGTSRSAKPAVGHVSDGSVWS